MSESLSAASAAVQQIDESLVSSCRATSNPYKRSMLRLLECVGLQHYGTPRATMPPRTSEEAARIAQHLDEVREAVARHQESVRRRSIRINKRKLNSEVVRAMQCAVAASGATKSDGACPTVSNDSAAGSSGRLAELPTIYLSLEESVEWKAFLASVEREDRHAVTVLRRLSVALWRAHQRDLCLWCWFPSEVCMCAELDAYRATLPAAVLDEHVEVTMLLHSEELMRSTNSGHIAAYLLGAPLRVWGLGEDDTYLQQLPPVEHRQAACAAEGPAVVYHVSLYPSSDAMPRAPAPATENNSEGAAVHPAPPLTVAVSGSHSKRKVHLILLDSTWNQALSLNRHITRSIPRVSLEIADDYESLFQALRKRTRETCVSTLEATSMAVAQCVRAMGYAAEAASTSQTLSDAMKRFVDARCLLKYANAQFSTSGEALEAFCNRRDDARRRDAARRQEVLAAQMQADESARRLRLPPVLNYCYVCDCVIGWHRMTEHVMGRSHRTALERNPSCTPSAVSRRVVVPDFSRPRRLAEKTKGTVNAPRFSGAKAESEHLPDELTQRTGSD
ncbi:DTW domain family protein [Leishmania donovani]|uniref:tRNA-uridine aminocarboxypropyltransferase n=1 Tax=Leishmania donovani TaxID=5661 RepID=A0A504XW86_LEIDO|nr:DTW domain family protein [Leishmania donovani]TPP52851.1 DTW domain family protein [Leishmania donovani]